MVKVLAKEQLAKSKPRMKLAAGVDLREFMRIVGTSRGANNKIVHAVEFFGSDDFSAAWYERQERELAMGMEEEPLLYTPLYDIIEDASLPKVVEILRLGPAHGFFAKIVEGGEVKFMSISESQATASIEHWALGIQYDKDLVMYNQTWNLGIAEREVGVAWNALRNHLHLSPFLTNVYASSNQTPANAGEVGDTIIIKYLRTLEDAVRAATLDTANRRKGPYWLMVSSANVDILNRALTPVPQQGFDMQSDVFTKIRGIIAYDGWTGSRGLLEETYDGVTAGKGYLISTGTKRWHHKSYVKQALKRTMGEADMSRFILEEVLYDGYMGVACFPEATTEEITWPT